jgi:hypothetical protein
MIKKLIRVQREVLYEVANVEDNDRALSLAMDVFRGEASHATFVTLLREKLDREFNPRAMIFSFSHPVVDFEREQTSRRLEIAFEENTKLTQELQIAKDEIAALTRRLALVTDQEAELQKTLNDFSDKAIADEPLLRTALRRVVEDSDILTTSDVRPTGPCWPWCGSWPSGNGPDHPCDCNAEEMRRLHAAALRPDIVTSGPERGKETVYAEELADMVRKFEADGVVAVTSEDFRRLLKTAGLVRRHQIERHLNCTKNPCNVCDGGLEICVVCRQAEATLEPTCPGEDKRIPLRLAGYDLLKFVQHKYGCEKLTPEPYGGRNLSEIPCTCGSDDAEKKWSEVTR